MVTITPEAHEEIVSMLEEEGEEGAEVTLRILLRPG